MSEYKVLITETWKRAVTVDAESREEAEAAVRCQYKNGEYALVSADSDGVSFSAQYPEQQVELSYGKLRELFRKAERGGIHVSGYITFRADSFSTAYSERSRTYAVSSDNKAFQPNMGGYSIYARCLDGTDPCVRLEQYAKTCEELYDKELDALSQLDDDRQRRKSPTVADYCEKWLVMQSAHVRTTTLTDYKSKVRRNIIPYLGDKKIAEVTLDDIQLALVSVSQKSASVYKSVIVIYKCIFRAAEESRIIKKNPTVYLSPKGGGVPQAEKQPLTDEQVQRLLDAVCGLPPYVFIMLGLYAGLRREEILGLQWDSVYLDTEAPYLTVRRAWHTEHNRPVISTELKTDAAERNIPLPDHLAACLREAKGNSTSDFVVANRDGGPLSYTQFKRLWQYVVTRTAKPRIARKLVDGKYVKYMLYPELGEKARNNGHVVYSLDFDVTPHLLRHTYITNLIHASVDPKTVQYLAGHENSRITMDIYAKVKYNRPDDVVKAMTGAFAEWDAS